MTDNRADLHPSTWDSALDAVIEGVLRSLADLKPETLAVMHGSSFRSKCDGLPTDLAGVIKETFDAREREQVGITRRRSPRAARQTSA